MNLAEFAAHLFLFYGIGDEELKKILDDTNTEIRTFSRSEIIYSPSEYEKKIGFVISGRCEVRRIKPDGGTVVLNILDRFDSFGILAVFSDCVEYPTEVYAAKNTDIMFITKEKVTELIKKHPTISMNIIKFLSDRIGFLNKKIATFSGTHVENKFSSYLLSEYEKKGDCFTLNCKKASEAINAGRASVYRAIESLCKENLIEFENKKINIKDPNGLKEISK